MGPVSRSVDALAQFVPPDKQARPDVAGSTERLWAFNAGQSLGGLFWHELRDQGRP
jgi:hypothetical protein